MSPGEAMKVMVTTNQQLTQPATIWRSDSGLRQKEQSGLCDNPHLVIFLRVGRELLMYRMVKL